MQVVGILIGTTTTPRALTSGSVKASWFPSLKRWPWFYWGPPVSCGVAAGSEGQNHRQNSNTKQAAFGAVPDPLHRIGSTAFSLKVRSSIPLLGGVFPRHGRPAGGSAPATDFPPEITSAFPGRARSKATPREEQSHPGQHPWLAQPVYAAGSPGGAAPPAHTTVSPRPACAGLRPLPPERPTPQTSR